MSEPKLPQDPKWTRAHTLFHVNASGASDVALIGIPAREVSISPTSANLTPGAIRNALARYSTYSSSRGTDLRDITLHDLGDVEQPDHESGEQKVAHAVANVLRDHKLLIALGGDNSITYSVAAGMWSDLSNVGLITLDAHHDLRDGVSNGSPVWRLIQAGLSGANVVQIGISDFANSREYAARAKDEGIHVITRDELRKRPISDVMAEALDIAGGNGREIYVDLDVDVCDRSVAPACPASVPGGISADELREAAFLAGADSRVRAIDITEIDAALDTADQRTIRLGALLVLEAASGVASRKN
ncbi:MAG: formimidoylglutamase [Actinobacteria bacterium]|nr:formimidoylglutamase [Actinomycetota bacterium]MSX25389.1 formimidoylglutamase [Actinomycetota bacterium]MSY46339.1 formimidoylglutamase [Actinomycetota bacterium]MSY57258.1 formimidoylglutamase [Actinomycetota bacterium]